MMAYLKKGSAAIVVGELQKPEIFTGREGQPQISLSVTASNIMFSPFGRTAGESVKTAEGAQTAGTAAESDFTADAAVVSGTNVKAEALADDEIPF
ncbi:MAG: hypothetical protein WC371_03405 [Parachlamydiales bacterium]|jgi:single-strand DNA-binding protein